VPATGGDWAAQTADTIDRVVGSVRGKTSEPLERIARIVVYGLLAAIVGLVALVLGVILLVRLLALLPGELWIAYLAAGGIFVVIGLLLWRKRTVKTVKV
jgi:MFS superfamily sulfate permease-like transporter